MAVIGFSRLLADEDGRVPAWWVSVMSLMFRGVWGSYDMVFKKVFGDGERTIYDGEGGDDEKEVGRMRGCERGCVRLEDYDEKKMSR